MYNVIIYAITLAYVFFKKLPVLTLNFYTTYSKINKK